MSEDIWVTATWNGKRNRWSVHITMRGLSATLTDTYKSEPVAYMAGVQALKRLLHATPVGAHTEGIR